MQNNDCYSNQELDKFIEQLNKFLMDKKMFYDPKKKNEENIVSLLALSVFQYSIIKHYANQDLINSDSIAHAAAVQILAKMKEFMIFEVVHAMRELDARLYRSLFIFIRDYTSILGVEDMHDIIKYDGLEIDKFLSEVDRTALAVQLTKYIALSLTSIFSSSSKNKNLMIRFEKLTIAYTDIGHIGDHIGTVQELKEVDDNYKMMFKEHGEQRADFDSLYRAHSVIQSVYFRESSSLRTDVIILSLQGAIIVIGEAIRSTQASPNLSAKLEKVILAKGLTINLSFFRDMPRHGTSLFLIGEDRIFDVLKAMPAIMSVFHEQMILLKEGFIEHFLFNRMSEAITQIDDAKLSNLFTELASKQGKIPSLESMNSMIPILKNALGSRTNEDLKSINGVLESISSSASRSRTDRDLSSIRVDEFEAAFKSLADAVKVEDIKALKIRELEDHIKQSFMNIQYNPGISDGLLKKVCNEISRNDMSKKSIREFTYLHHLIEDINRIADENDHSLSREYKIAIEKIKSQLDGLDEIEDLLESHRMQICEELLSKEMSPDSLKNYVKKLIIDCNLYSVEMQKRICEVDYEMIMEKITSNIQLDDTRRLLKKKASEVVNKIPEFSSLSEDSRNKLIDVICCSRRERELINVVKKVSNDNTGRYDDFAEKFSDSVRSFLLDRIEETHKVIMAETDLNAARCECVFIVQMLGRIDALDSQDTSRKKTRPEKGKAELLAESLAHLNPSIDSYVSELISENVAYIIRESLNQVDVGKLTSRVQLDHLIDNTILDKHNEWSSKFGKELTLHIFTRMELITCSGGRRKVSHSIIKRSPSSNQLSSSKIKCLSQDEINDIINHGQDQTTHYRDVIDSEKFLTQAKKYLEYNPDKLSTAVSLIREREVTGDLSEETRATVKVHDSYRYLKKVEWLSSRIALTMAAKDILFDLIRGEYADVAIDLISLGIPTFLHSLGSSISSGKILNNKAVASLISKMEIGGIVNYLLKSHPQNAAVKKFLSNKHISNLFKSSAIRKAVKNQILTSFGSIISRSVIVLDIFVLYESVQHLVECINDHNTKKDSLSKCDLGTAKYEIAKMELEQSEFDLQDAIVRSACDAAHTVLGQVTGKMDPVSMCLDIVITIGFQIYSAVRTVEKIEMHLPLTSDERFTVGLNSFFGLEIHQNLIESYQIIYANKILVAAAKELLRSNPQISRCVFPSAVMEYNKDKNELRPAQSEKSTIMLDNKVENIQWIREIPDNLEEGFSFFCLPEGDYQPSNGPTYRCENAIGLEYSKDRKGDYTVINLGKGYHTVKGFLSSENIFLISEGYKEIIGGNKDDTFILEAIDKKCKNSELCGRIHGLAGSDTIDASKLQSEIEINFPARSLRNEETLFEIEDINNFIGVKDGIDKVTTSCNTYYIDTKGGVRDNYRDNIRISDHHDCNHNMVIVAGRYTTIDNYAKMGKFTYVLNDRKGNVLINLMSDTDVKTKSYDDKPKHTFVFNNDLHNISQLEVAVNMISVGFSDSQGSSLTRIYTNRQSDHSYYLQSGEIYTRLIPLPIGSYAIQRRDITEEEHLGNIVPIYLDTASKLKIHVVVSTKEETLVIGNSNYDSVIENDYKVKQTHLVGSSGTNLFSITTGCQKDNRKSYADSADQYGRTPMHYIFKSVQDKNAVDLEKIISIFMDVKADFNAQDKDGRTPLHLAAIKSNLDIIRFITTNKYTNVDVNAIDKDGRTPLHLAIAKGNVAIANAIIELGAKTDIKDKDGKIPNELTPIDDSHPFDIGGYDVDLVDQKENKPLHNAVVEWNIDEAKRIIDSLCDTLTAEMLPINKVLIYHFSKINQINTLDLTRMIKEVKDDLNDQVNFKITSSEKDLELHSYLNSDPNKEVVNIVLRDALEYHWYKMLYVATGANIPMKIETYNSSEFALVPSDLVMGDPTKTIYVITPDDIKIQNKVKIKKMMLDYIFLQDDKTLIITNYFSNMVEDKYGSIILVKDFYSEEHRRAMEMLSLVFDDVVITLRDEKVNIDRAELFIPVAEQYTNDGYKSIFLYLAIRNGILDQVINVLEQGADVNAIVRGVTPLHMACENGQFEIINYLVEKGAKIHIKVNNKTPIDVLKEKGYVDEADLISNKLKESLFNAMENRQLKVIKDLIVQGVDINSDIGNGVKPLHLAAEYELIDIVKLLINKGAKFDIRVSGSTPMEILVEKGHESETKIIMEQLKERLFDAIKSKDSDTAKALLMQGLDVDIKDDDMKTPLYYAEIYGLSELVEFIKSRGENNKDEEAEKRKKELQKKLFDRVKNKDYGGVKELVIQGFDVNAQDEDGSTSLHYAAQHFDGNLDIFNFLLDSGARIDIKVNGKTPIDILKDVGYENDAEAIVKNLTDKLFGYIQNRDYQNAKLIINQGIEVNEAKDINDKTLLHYSCEYCMPEIVEMLVARNPLGIYDKDNQGNVPLHYAAQGGSVEVLENLIKGCNNENKSLYVNSKNKQDYTPLHFASLKGQLGIIDYLVDSCGANVSSEMFNKATPLHCALMQARIEAADHLIQRNAKIDAVDTNNIAPIHYASMCGDVTIVNIILDKFKDNINDLSNHVGTPLHCAAQDNKLPIPIAECLVNRGANPNIKGGKNLDSPLHCAISRGEIDIDSRINLIDCLVKIGVDVNSLDNKGKTPLHYAASRSAIDKIKKISTSEKLKMVASLIQNCAKPDLRDSDNKTPLDYAKESGQHEIVDYISKHMNLHMSKLQCKTPETLNLETKLDRSLKIVNTLINSGSCINEKNYEGDSPAEILRRRGLESFISSLDKKQRQCEIYEKSSNKRMVENLLNTSSDSINTDELVENLFDSIIRKDNSLFIDKNDISKLQDHAGRTLLHAAASKGYMVVARYLVETAGAEVNAIDRVDQTPLYSAIFNDQLEVVRYLVEECEANISHRDTNQETPLHFAVLEGKAKISEYLISQGAEVNTVDDAGQTPLHLAVVYGRDEIAKHLITKSRTDVNAFDINGNTTLHHAAIKNNIDMVHYLIKNGADIYEKNVNEQTPIDILKANGHEVKGIIRQFGLNKTLISAVENNDITKVKSAIRNGADSNAKTESGETILSLAVSGGESSIEIVRFLRQQGETKSLRRVKRSGERSISTYSDSDSGIESDNENSCEESRTGSIIGNFVSRVKRSISGFFDYSNEENPKPIEVKNYVPSSTRIDTEPVSITENIDVNGNLLLLNVLVRKVTGKAFVSCSHSISPEEATGCAMSITNEFERGIRKAAKDSNCKVSFNDLGYLLFSNVFSDVKKSLIQGNYTQVEGILHSFAKDICPQNNKKFMRFVDIEIKNMLIPQDSKIMEMDALRKDQPSSLVNQVDIQSMSQRRLIA